MTKFGKYEVLEKIGMGGFATVYKGFDPNIKRFVAIKTCSNDDEDMRTRFNQEAEIAGSLQHRNIVTVYDFGDQEGVPFLVQEYLTGEDLDRKIRRRDQLAYAERVLYLIQIARGLDYAHQKGVIHRDIKPANIRILEDGATRIMDFGIAKLAARQTGLTQTGMTLGTAAYLSPEQIRGDAADQRTDIFSFGSLAYELLTYERPFTGDVIPNVLYRILNHQPKPITAFWPECPPQLAQLVARCMEKDPDRRYPNCAALLADLDPALRVLRAQPQSSQAAASPREASDAMPTAALRSGPTVQHSQETAEFRAASDERTVRDIGDMAIGYRSESERRTPRSISTSAVYRSERRRWPLLAAAIVAVALGAGAWLYFGRPQTEPASTAATAALQPAEAAPVQAPSDSETNGPTSTGVAGTEIVPPAGPDAGAVDLPTGSAPAAAPASPGQPGSVPTGGTDSAATSTTAPEPPAPPGPATPPPPPAKSTVIVPRAWSGDMTVVVDGGEPRKLDRAQTLTLAPGNHVLSFSLVLPDYTESGEVEVTLKAGQNRTVTTPLKRPGRLTVQPALGSPVGMVRVDGESLGLSPVRNKTLRAGQHRLEIVPARAEDGQAISIQVSVPEDQAVVVTFNLRRPEEPPQVVARPLGSS